MYDVRYYYYTYYTYQPIQSAYLRIVIKANIVFSMGLYLKFYFHDNSSEFLVNIISFTQDYRGVGTNNVSFDIGNIYTVLLYNRKFKDWYKIANIRTRTHDAHTHNITWHILYKYTIYILYCKYTIRIVSIFEFFTSILLSANNKTIINCIIKLSKG